jgi:hypothetical protein
MAFLACRSRSRDRSRESQISCGVCGRPPYSPGAGPILRRHRPTGIGRIAESLFPRVGGTDARNCRWAPRRHGVGRPRPTPKAPRSRRPRTGGGPRSDRSVATAAGELPRLSDGGGSEWTPNGCRAPGEWAAPNGSDGYGWARFRGFETPPGPPPSPPLNSPPVSKLVKDAVIPERVGRCL